MYIKRFPERGAPIQVSRGGGRRPLWSRSGDELYYLAKWKAALMRVEIELGASPRVGEAQSIELSSDLMPQDWYPWGSVAADGRLALVRRSTQTAGHVNVVLNWFDELRELSP